MNYDTLKKYLEGKTTEAESELISEWLNNPDNDFESRKILGDIWMNSDIRLRGTFPDFNSMLNQMHRNFKSQKNHPLKQKSRSNKRISILYNIFSKVAAILILPLFFVSIYFYMNPIQDVDKVASTSTSNIKTTTTTREVYTKPGTRTRIKLSDGTLVWLNDGTTFRYPEQFIGGNREVFVNGEAYFEVKSDIDNPFVVNNAMMKTVVTGTHFNINAYVADNFFEATLLEGKVSLKKNNQEVTMVPGEQMQFDIQLNQIVQKDVNPKNAIAWINGQLIFKDEHLGTAIKKLGRWFNIEIILTDPELKDYLLTGTIQDEKLIQTLDMITLALPMKYEFKKENNPTKIQRTVYIMKK